VGRLVSGSPTAATGADETDDYEEEIVETTEAADDDSSEPGKRTPSTDSNEDSFEMLESTDSLAQAKTTGSQAVGGKTKSNKRKGKKK